MARYDGVADWYREFRPALTPAELGVLRRLLGAGTGRCVDVGCGTGLGTAAVAELGWSAIGVDVSEGLLEIGRKQGLELVLGSADALPFADADFDAAVSIWTHSDVDDFHALVSEVARVLKADAPFVYVGGHPCFIGPHSLFRYAEGVPGLHPGYRPGRRYDASAPGVFNPDGLRARVGASHVPLGEFVDAFGSAGLRIQHFEELGEDDYPYLVALRAYR
jgi:SAM-dependent methyltransferase